MSNMKTKRYLPSVGWLSSILIGCMIMLPMFMGCSHDCKSCEKKVHEQHEQSKALTKDVMDLFYMNRLSVVEIDGCEYIFISAGYSSMLAHKGNCRFCTERYQKIISEHEGKAAQEASE